MRENNILKNKRHAQHRGNPVNRRALAQIAVGIVAFYTVQMLVSPVFALESTDPAPDLTGMVMHQHNTYCYDSAQCLICPIPELVDHVHTDVCYEIPAVETAPTEPPHVHSDSCYTSQKGDITCVFSEEHTHEDACYETRRLEASSGNSHIHTDACYRLQLRDLTCVLPECTGHTHTDNCYIWGQTPICGTAESDSHSHTNSCYYKTLACVTPESAGHIHSDACYQWELVLSCGIEVAAPAEPTYEQVLVCSKPVHSHSDTCFEWTDVLSCPEGNPPTDDENVLICTKPEFQNHIHDENCFDAENTDPICGQQQLEEHIHTEDCLVFSDDALVCELKVGQNHAHNYCCYSRWTFLCYDQEKEVLPDEPVETLPPELISDPTADVENAGTWEKTFAHVELTDVYAQDLLAIAQTQLGYEESTRNFLLTQANDKKGYTRYGKWWGYPYGDWCAMFASFCLNYAQVRDFPQQCKCSRWIPLLIESGMYADSTVYTPKPGDLVFFDYARYFATSPCSPSGADHVGIVADVIPATQDEPAKLITIEGNHYNSVCYDSYALNSPFLLGYGILPDGPAAVYSCGLEAHTHNTNCLDPQGNLLCSVPEHTHDKVCRSRNLQFSNDSMQVEVTLTNAVSVPTNLRLNVVPLTQDVKEIVSTVADTMSKLSYQTGTPLFFRIELLADGKPYQLPDGVRAEVQISFKKPILGSNAAAGKSQLYTLLLTEATGKKVAATRYQAEQVPIVEYACGTNGITKLHFSTSQVSSFALTYAVRK